MTWTLNTWFTVNPILKTWKCWSWNCQDVSHPVMPIFLHTMFLLLIWRILLTTSFNETISELFFVQKPSQVPSVKYYDRTVTNHPLKIYSLAEKTCLCVCCYSPYFKASVSPKSFNQEKCMSYVAGSNFLISSANTCLESCSLLLPCCKVYTDGPSLMIFPLPRHSSPL